MNRDKIFIIDLLAFLGIGAYCLFVSIFGTDFAKLALYLPYINFPVFISEQLLFILVVLLVIKWSMTKQLSFWSWAWSVYFIWIFLQILVGLVQWGPLTLRNAALFYYVFFFYFGLFFYNRRIFLHSWIYAGLVSVLGISLLSNIVGSYYWFSYYVFLMILIFHKRLNFMFPIMAMFSLILFTNNFFYGSRSHLVAMLVVLIFFSVIFILHIKNQIKIFYLFLGIAALIVTLIFGYKYLSDVSNVKSITSPIEVIHQYKQYNSFINIHGQGYRPSPLNVSLFHKTWIVEKRQFEEVGLDGEDVFMRLIMNGLATRISPTKVRMDMKFDIDKRTILTEFGSNFSKVWSILQQSHARSFDFGFFDQSNNFIFIKEVCFNCGVSLKRFLEKFFSRKEVVAAEAGNSLNFQSQVNKESNEMNKIIPLELKDISTSLSMKPVVNDANVIQSVENEQKVVSMLPTVDHQENMMMKPKTINLQESSPKDLSVEDKINEGSLEKSYINILFRLFIWRDMWVELYETRSILGVGFGKPQRSKSIEILKWATTEWWRDGWITPHNSYIHMIYRAGLIGLIVILGFIFIFIQLLKDFLYFRSLKGILCLSALLYWMVMANFLLIFEFPYHAILFWSLFGMTYAYAQELKNKL